jgi:transcriptional regulator GlxA family with amidase domain
MPISIGIYTYDEAEVLDFSGPFEAFSTATRICADDGPFDVCLIAENNELIRARAGYRVQADFTISDHPDLDVLMVVGGDHTGELEKPVVISWITAQAERVDLIASVCTGAFLPAKAGVLSNERVTTHWADQAQLQADYPELQVIPDGRWVDEDHVVTSGRISAGIDMALHLVSRLHSRTLAEKTARQMDFSWTRHGA